MSKYDNFFENAPTWVWAYVEAQGMKIKRTFNITGYKQKGEQQ